MTNQWPTGEKFIDEWIEKEAREDQLDQELLSLIDDHRNGATLGENELLKEIIAIAETESEENAED